MSLYELLSLIIQGLGFVVLAATLCFLAFQTIRLRESTRNAAYQSLFQSYNQLNYLLVQDPVLGRAFRVSRPGVPTLSDDELAFYNFMSMITGLMEQVYMRRENKWVDHEIWESWDRWISQVWVYHPMFDTFWENEGRYSPEKFVGYINDLREKRNQTLSESVSSSEQQNVRSSGETAE